MATKFDFSQPITQDLSLYATYNCSEINPEEHTFANLKLALATGSPSTYYPIGSLFPSTLQLDNKTYDIFWRVVHYGEATLAETGATVQGVYLDTTQAIICGSNLGNAVGYKQTVAYTNIQVPGWEAGIADELKSIVATVAVPQSNLLSASSPTNGVSQVIETYSFFPPSAKNMGSTADGTALLNNGPMFDYYKDIGSVTYPTRVKTNITNNAPIAYVTRDMSTANLVASSVRALGYSASGGQEPIGLASNFGVAVCCFIPA